MKKPMATNEERNNDAMQPILLCIALLTSSKIFNNFVETNNLRKELIEIAKNSNGKENDIGEMFMDILHQFNSQLKLEDQIFSIFGIKKTKCKQYPLWIAYEIVLSKYNLEIYQSLIRASN